MPAVKGVGEPCAGEPHARIDAAAGGNRNQSGSHSRTELGASRRPYSDLSACRDCRNYIQSGRLPKVV
jgi:hypothetical protein